MRACARSYRRQRLLPVSTQGCFIRGILFPAKPSPRHGSPRATASLASHSLATPACLGVAPQERRREPEAAAGHSSFILTGLSPDLIASAKIFRAVASEMARHFESSCVHTHNSRLPRGGRCAIMMPRGLCADTPQKSNPKQYHACTNTRTVHQDA